MWATLYAARKTYTHSGGGGKAFFFWENRPTIIINNYNNNNRRPGAFPVRNRGKLTATSRKKPYDMVDVAGSQGAETTSDWNNDLFDLGFSPSPVFCSQEIAVGNAEK